MNKKVALHNLGCKVNSYELEAMQQMLEDHGYEIVPFQPGADVYIINTCTVTNIADRKSRQMLHKAKKMNPQAIVVATGCYAQAAQETLDVDEAVDIVIGNNKKQDLIAILEGRETDAVININQTHEYENLHIDRTAEHTRAYIKVQDGCNQFCTYCIIPYARGRVRSRDKQDVLQEVARLAAAGYQEVVLTGIHLSSYGVDFADHTENLQTLIQAVHGVDGIRRIRLGSLEPGIITESFAEALAGLPKVCPHFHLSMQSGCDATLKRMNRRYDTKEFMGKCRILRKYFADPAITTDIIVGFPQESEEEFGQTVEFVETIDFAETHIFKYSRRKGTKAAAMEGQIPEEIKTKRSHVLLDMNEKHRAAYAQKWLGRTVEALLEEQVEEGGETCWSGHTKEYLHIRIQSQDDLANTIVSCQVTDVARGGILNGKIIGKG
ncbi:MAG: tRNA (N(6)-L-threonylcarbamoyladenosine(37)-C(2))-methylthiotransferase MtaB [Lachnospiraceae bacterium]|nr:tRNA (N(6)-L-threonylcarbamoyladenosine(37)-C(2))-methylthiotransferase MtaB [Lachnospiraceae bacterium]